MGVTSDDGVIIPMAFAKCGELLSLFFRSKTMSWLYSSVVNLGPSLEDGGFAPISVTLTDFARFAFE